jgi:broad specificity phosphatase PhoE
LLFASTIGVKTLEILIQIDPTININSSSIGHVTSNLNTYISEERTEAATMGKITIHCVRHAQGFHNLNTANHALHDPSLTPLGEEQCATLAQNFPYHSQITYLVASPLRRTIYTCLLSFPTEVSRGLKVIALPEIQETSDLPCDTGSDPSTLAEEFGKGRFKDTVDLSRLHAGWNSNTGKWSPAAPALEARAREARQFLLRLAFAAQNASSSIASDDDVDIVVVTHGGFLHYFTEDWVGHDQFVGTGWANTEYRSYEFVSDVDEGASLQETSESRTRRLGKEIPLTADEQRELRATAEKGWQASGFQTPPTTEGQEDLEAKL